MNIHEELVIPKWLSIVTRVNMFSKSAVTNITLIRPISRVYMHVYFNSSRLKTVCHINYI